MPFSRLVQVHVFRFSELMIDLPEAWHSSPFIVPVLP